MYGILFIYLFYSKLSVDIKRVQQLSACLRATHYALERLAAYVSFFVLSAGSDFQVSLQGA